MDSRTTAKKRVEWGFLIALLVIISLAFAVLIVLQFVVTWTSVRHKWFRRVMTGEPRLLLHDGELLRDAMRAARVTGDEIHAALRSHGLSGPREAKAVVIETDGSFSVIKQQAREDEESLVNVGGSENG